MPELRDWMRELASDAPAPGGGGASALTGACAAALGAMVANLTKGNPKYADVREDMCGLAAETSQKSERLFTLIEADREAFLPLAAAYRIPKDRPDRAEILESALRTAAGAPMEMLRAASEIPPLLSVLLEKGSRLAVSDVGCAAALCAAAAKASHLNVLVNTGLMKDRPFAEAMDEEAGRLLAETETNCEILYEAVRKRLAKEPSGG